MQTLIAYLILFVVILVGGMVYLTTLNEKNLIQDTNDNLLRKIDSLRIELTYSKRQVEAQREHFAECAFISRYQIKKTVHKYWLELYKEGDVNYKQILNQNDTIYIGGKRYVSQEISISSE